MAGDDRAFLQLKEAHEKLLGEYSKILRSNEILFEIIEIYQGGCEGSFAKNVKLDELSDRLDTLSSLIDIIKLQAETKGDDRK